MTVSSKTVQGRRALKFNSFDEIVADAGNLVASPKTKTLGNWPLSQLLTHLARAMNSSIDGISFQSPWFFRMIGPFLKPRILKRGMPAGFQLPKARESAFYPAASSLQSAFEEFKKAAARAQNEKMTAKHPVFGALTHEDWVRFHLRHAELHLSFAVPG